MKPKNVRVAIACLTLALFGYLLSEGRLLLSMVVFLIGFFAYRYFLNKSKEVIQDERTYRISEMVSRRTLQAIAITLLLIALISYSNIFSFSEEFIRGVSLLVLFIYTLYLFFYVYYSRMMG